MAKRKELKEMQDTLDQRESEKIQAAAKAAKAEETLKAAKAAKEDSEADSIRDSLMEEMKIRAQAEDYSRLQKENESLMDRVLDLEKRLRLAETAAVKEKEEEDDADEDQEEVDLGETEDDFPEEILDETDDSDEDSEVVEENKEPVKPVTSKPVSSNGKDGKKTDKASKKPVMVHSPKPKENTSEVKPPKKQQAPAVIPNVVIPQKTPSTGHGHPDGPGTAYKYWSYKDRCWKLTQNVWVANQFGSDIWEPIPVWFKDGQINHILTEEECEKYLP